MKKFKVIGIIVILILAVIVVYYGIQYYGGSQIEISKISSQTDYNNNGISDSEDILIGARKDLSNKPTYISKYYAGGYPPDNEGVCTDVIWRALKEAGYNLKDMVDNDVKNNVELYPRVEGRPDANIDFRRVPNLKVFFDRKYEQLTIDVVPNNMENLIQWQGGDIVIFDSPNQHIAVVSDKRNNDGVPYIIHNAGPYTKEENMLLYWDKHISKIVGHYRISK